LLAIFSDSFTLIAAVVILFTLVIQLASIIVPKFVKNQRVLNFVSYLDRKVLWNSLLRYSITAYLKFAIIAIKNLRVIDNLSAAVACFKVIFLILICIFPM